MKKLLLFSLLLLLVFQAQAQKDFRPGYIVNLQGDTLKGEVNYKGDIKSAQECSFRASATASEENYKPNQLTGYGFKNGIFYEAKSAKIVNPQINLANQFDYVPVAGNDTINFMQVLVKGQASLYFMKDAIGAPHYFFQQKNNPVKELIYIQTNITNPKTGGRYPYRSKLYVGVLKVAFKDCTSISSKIDKTGFKQSEFQNLFYEYNMCIAPSQKIILKTKPKPEFTWGAMAGMSFSSLKIVVDEWFIGHGEFDSKPAPTAGLFLDFTIPVTNEKLSISNAVYYTQRNYTADYYYNTYEYSISNYRAAYKFNYLRLENNIRYTMPIRKFTPYGQIGISNSLMLTNSEEISSTKYYMDYPPEDRQEPQLLTPIMRKHQIGFPAAIGIKHVLGNGNQIFMQFNYEFNTGFTKGVGIATNSHNNAILLGFGF